MALHLDIGVTGYVLGMPAEALVFGFMGGVVYVMFGGVMNREKSLSTVFVSMILAGVATPLMLSWLAGEIDWQVENKSEMLKTIVPFGIGLAWRWVLPRVIGAVETWLNVRFGKSANQENEK